MIGQRNRSHVFFVSFVKFVEFVSQEPSSSNIRVPRAAELQQARGTDRSQSLDGLCLREPKNHHII